MARMTVDERRTKLVEAAVLVMSREGVAHTTTRSVVAEAGMQIGVFHYCFRSKDDLMHEVMEVITERGFDAVSAALRRPADPGQLIAGTVDAYWRHLIERPEEVQLTYELTQHALREPSMRAAAEKQYARYAAAMEQLLLDLGRAGGFEWRTPVDVLARLLLAMVRGITMQWLVSRDDAMARRLLDEVVAHLHREASAAPPAGRSTPAR